MNVLDVQLGDPTRIRPAIPYPGTFKTDDTDKDGTQPASFSKGMTAEQWVTGIHGTAMEKIRQIAASINPGPAFPYLSQASAADLRMSINGYFAAGTTQCNGYASIKAWALVTSGALPASDVKVVQAYANGGWHNVALFKNPETHLWDVINYNNVVTVGADSPSAAAESYFGNAQLIAIYHIKDAASKPVVDYLDNSAWRALMGGEFAAPGIGQAMNPIQGAQEGMNEMGGPGRPPAQQKSLSFDNQGGFLRYDDVTVMARRDPVAGADRYGFSVLHATSSTDVAGGKITAMHEPGGGWSIFAGGEWWRFSDHGYIGVVAGLELRDGIRSETMDGVPLNTLGPVAGVNGGNDVDIVGHKLSVDDKPSRFYLGWFWNGRFRVGVPITLTKPDQAQVLANANGVSPGGYIDPGFVGLADVNVNSGLRAQVHATQRFTIDAQAALRLQAFDPTFNGWPVIPAFAGKIKASYDSDNLAATLAVQGGTGIFARDVVIGPSGTLGLRVGSKVTVGVLASGGLYKDGTPYATAGANVDFKLGTVLGKPVSGQVWGGAIGQGQTQFTVRPTGGVVLTGHF
jgi:hypothetical protein